MNFPVRQGISDSIICYGKTELRSNSSTHLSMGCYSNGSKRGFMNCAHKTQRWDNVGPHLHWSEFSCLYFTPPNLTSPDYFAEPLPCVCI